MVGEGEKMDISKVYGQKEEESQEFINLAKTLRKNGLAQSESEAKRMAREILGISKEVSEQHANYQNKVQESLKNGETRDKDKESGRGVSVGEPVAEQAAEQAAEPLAESGAAEQETNAGAQFDLDIDSDKPLNELMKEEENRDNGGEVSEGTEESMEEEKEDSDDPFGFNLDKEESSNEGNSDEGNSNERNIDEEGSAEGSSGEGHGERSSSEGDGEGYVKGNVEVGSNREVYNNEGESKEESSSEEANKNGAEDAAQKKNPDIDLSDIFNVNK